MRLRCAALAGLGLVLLGAAWVVATRPFAAPDEPFHYLRAAGIADGQWLGPKARYENPSLPAAQLAWVQHSSRAVRVSAALVPPGFPCAPARLGTGRCVETTTVGNYHPLPYLLPALGIKLADTSDTALWFARAASALECLAFILLAVALLWDGSAWSLAGLLVAITPMVLFVGSVLNPNGLEIAAAIALAAAVIRLARRPGPVTPWVWVALASSGAVTILAWQLGPVFAVIDLALLAGLLSRGELRELLREHRTALFWTSAILAGAVAIWLVYGQFSGAEHSTIRLSLVRAHGGLSQLTAVLREAIGDFGLVNVPLPTPVRLVWWLLVIGLVALAVLLGRRRERVLMVSTVAVALVFPVLFYDWVYRFSGYPLQGRYVLPVLVLVPLLAGELIGRHSGDWRARRSSLIPAGLIALTALVQTYAWWYASSFAAGRPRTLQFFDHASWSPPLGWTPWIAIAAVGAVALLGFAGTARVAARK